MPLKLPQGLTDDIFVVGLDDNNVPGVPLLASQVASIISADPLSVVVVQDPTPRPTTIDFDIPQADGTVVHVPAGTVTQLSAKVSAAKPVAQPNVPINVTFHIENSDGTPVLDDTGQPITNLTDTVTTGPGVLKKEGMVFGVPA